MMNYLAKDMRVKKKVFERAILKDLGNGCFSIP